MLSKPRWIGMLMVMAGAGLVATAVPVTARADVMSTAVLDITGLTFSNSSGATLSTSDFSFLTYTSTGGYAGTLPGTTGYNASGQTPSGTYPAGVDLPKVCVGSGCAAWNTAYGPENSFTQLPPPPVGNYSAADQQESGAPINGLTGFPLGAVAKNGSYAGLTTQTGLSHATSTNNLNASLVFALNQATAVSISEDINAFIMAYVTSDEVFPGFATAAVAQSWTLTNLTTNTGVFSWTPDIFGNGGGTTVSLNAPLPINVTSALTTGGPLNFTNTTPLLVAGDLYQLSVRSNANADASRTVPEPGTLMLLGAGLLGLGVSLRRARRRA